MARGVFSSAGVVHLWVQREADVSNFGALLLYRLDDLEVIAAEKGGIRKLRDEKSRKVYQALRVTLSRSSAIVEVAHINVRL